VSRRPVITAARLVRVLNKLGFELARRRGSHAFYRHADGRSTVVPMHAGEDIRRGLLRAILRDLELSPEEFEKLL
jgi:predicted RNA binding protein YcfA (HicA-like mRNA interferase family)